MRTYISTQPYEPLTPKRIARVTLYATLEERQAGRPYTPDDLRLYRTVALTNGDSVRADLLDDLVDELETNDYDGLLLSKGRVTMGYITPQGRFFEECGRF
jgi:hypothetical protein